MMTIAQQLKQEGFEQGIHTGIQEGFEKGIHKGVQQGEAAVIIRLLERRFGQIPQQYELRIKQADAETLLKLSERILEAKGISELFEKESV